VFINQQKSHWIFDNDATKSIQQTMISSDKCWVLEDEFRDLGLADLGLLFYYLTSDISIGSWWEIVERMLTKFEDGEDEGQFVLPEEMVAAVAEDASGTENDHFVNGVLSDGVVDLIASTTPVG
jgi:hypothetical protein